VLVSAMQPKITVADKVMEFYKIDKKLCGLITVTELMYTEKIGRDVIIVIPELNSTDKILVNGIEFVPIVAGKRYDTSN
jgi:hypothetical protein